MEFQLLDQIGLFGIFLLFGMVLGVYYTSYKLLRYFVRFTQRAIFFQDIIFFVTAAIGTYMLLMNVGTGEVRGYILIALCLGFAVYYFTLGAVVFCIGKFLIDIFKKISSFFNRKIVAPIHRCVTKIIGQVFRYGRKISVRLCLAIKKSFLRPKKIIKKQI